MRTDEVSTFRAELSEFRSHLAERDERIRQLDDHVRRRDDRLKEKDDILQQVIMIINNDNNNKASLPVKNGGLGIRSVTTLAPSAFLDSAASTLTLQDVMLAQFGNTAPDPAITRSTLAWSAMTNDMEPVYERKHIQKAYPESVGWCCHIETAKFSADEGNNHHPLTKPVY